MNLMKRVTRGGSKFMIRTPENISQHVTEIQTMYVTFSSKKIKGRISLVR